MRIERSSPRWTLGGFCVIALIVGRIAASPDIASFSRGVPGALPIGWHVQTFRHTTPTRYKLVRDDDRVALEADSRDSASALIAEADVDLLHTPSIDWSWKIDHVITGARWGRKRADDFAARVFVIFAYGEKSVASLLAESLSKTGNIRALNYVWANDGVAGRMGVSPYTVNVMMIAVEAGPAKAGTWVTERRNVVEDFRRAFRMPPPPVRGLAVMTDTDNTHARERTLYGDVRFVGEATPRR